MVELKRARTLVLVTNNTKQAARVGDRTAFLLMGELVEVDATDKLFTSPSDTRTEQYVAGKFG
jgi:phosphate transport system ATP-binding protein